MDENRIDDEAGRVAALRRYDILDNAAAEPFQRVVDLVQKILGVPIAAVTLIDEDTQWFKALAGIEGVSGPRAIAFCNETIKQHDPLAIPNTLEDGRFAENPLVLGELHARAYLGVPLRSPDGYNVGTLCAIDRVPREFDARQGEILAKLAEIVVEQLELRQIAKQDSMTGALSRRGFFGEVEREYLRASRYDRPSSLVIIDVDHFKSINDRYGHPAGDAVLISIANACMSTMRKSDIFGRIGGEEFALLLPETEPHEAIEAAERIRRSIEATIVEAGGASIRVTVSLGVAPIPQAAEGTAGWFSEADIALYEAKQFGRNRVVVGKPRRPMPMTLTAAPQPTLSH